MVEVWILLFGHGTSTDGGSIKNGYNYDRNFQLKLPVLQ